MYTRRWAVFLRGERIGEVLAATEKAACARAIQRFKIAREDQSDLEVRRVATSKSQETGRTRFPARVPPQKGYP
jgi:hypothetical protein